MKVTAVWHEKVTQTRFEGIVQKKSPIFCPQVIVQKSHPTTQNQNHQTNDKRQNASLSICLFGLLVHVR
jgi:hypothetical protein